MKRLASFIGASLQAFALAGCADFDLSSLAEAIVNLAESVADKNTSTAKGATAGKSSLDAANALMSRDGCGAGKDTAALVLVEIENHDGNPITIDTKRFKVHAPSNNAGAAQIAIQPPKQLSQWGSNAYERAAKPRPTCSCH
jgi:hypothetical protein